MPMLIIAYYSCFSLFLVHAEYQVRMDQHSPTHKWNENSWQPNRRILSWWWRFYFLIWFQAKALESQEDLQYINDNKKSTNSILGKLCVKGTSIKSKRLEFYWWKISFVWITIKDTINRYQILLFLYSRHVKLCAALELFVCGSFFWFGCWQRRLWV